MPDDSGLGSPTPRVDWDRLRPGNDVRKSFEDLCCFLAERETAPDEPDFERLAPPDGGVECLLRLPGGQEWGWQAKYFRAAPSHSQWRQIDMSVRKSLESSPRLARYVVCVPVDKTRAGAAKWGRLVEQWNAIRPIAYEYWGRHELESRLIIDKNHDLLKYYFDKEFLSAEWAGRAVSTAIADAGPRYTPEQNIDLPIGKSFAALCGTGEFFGRLVSLAASMRDHLSAAASKPALDAAGSEFAKLGKIIDALASLLTGHALHKRDVIPVAEFKGESHEAMAAISSIASKLAGKGQESGEKQADRRYAGDAFDMERHHLRLLYGDLDELTDGKLSEDIDIHKTRALLVVGDAGVGKTHLFCDMAKRRTEQKQMTVLLHGSHFYGGPPKEAIIQDLDLDCRFSELLEGLNLAGQLSGSRSLLMIDALNEGAGRDTWKRHIRGLLQEIGRFPHVALAVSVRTDYEPDVVPDDIKPSALRRIEHPGFGGRTEAALARFFDSNGIERPAVPVMTPEYSNPQFLTVLCRGLKNKGYTRMPDNVDGITAVYDLFIDSVNDKLAEGGKLGIARDFKIVHRAIDAIAGRIVEGNGESLEYTEAHRLLSGLEPTLNNLGHLLDALISEGVLGAYSSKSQSRAHVRRISFAYERMSDNLVIKSLLDAVAANGGGGPAALLKESEPLTAYAANPARHRGLVDALSAQLPERFETELLEAAEGAPVKELTESFLDSLLWRSPRSIGDAAVRLVDELLTERRFSGRVLKALLAHSTNPDSPLNADYLHRRLLGLGMADRDSYLAAFLQGNPVERHSIVASLTSWAGNEGKKFGDDTIRLAGLALGWLLTSSNRLVRDLSTKALVSMFSGREGLLVDVMSEFRGCDDPYVAERLFCAAYGLAMRSRSNEGLGRLAAYAYETVFESGSPPPDIMLRDYARGIILLAEHRGVGFGVDLGSCSPPHNSDWIAEFPSETDIKNLEQLHGASRGGRGASSIFHSLGQWGDFYRYVVGGDEDGGPWINARLPEDKTTWPEALLAFDRSVTPAQEQVWGQLVSMLSDRMRADTLVIDPKTDCPASSDQYCDAMLEDLVRRFEPLLSPVQAARFNDRILRHLKYSLRPFSEQYGFDTAQFARWIAKRVFDLGWTADRFEVHDAALGSRPAILGGAERVGKKYQWIAYHELLARLSDNFEFADPDGTGQASVYESSQLLSKRDIDPSLPYSLAAAEAARHGPCGGSWAAVVRGGLDVIRSDDEWLKDASDLPDFGKMLTVTDGGGARWLALDMFYAADSRPVRGQAERPCPYRRVALWARSAVVPKKGGSALAGLARRRRLGLLKFPSSIELHGAFLGELYWANRFQKDHGGARPDDGIEIVVPGGGRIDAYRTTYKYHTEGDHDFSLEKNTTILVPSTFLARGMNLASMCDGTFSDAGGARIACDVAASKTNPHTLLFRQGPLSEFLASSGCELVWNVVAHKYVMVGHNSGEGSEHALHSIFLKLANMKQVFNTTNAKLVSETQMLGVQNGCKNNLTGL